MLGALPSCVWGWLSVLVRFMRGRWLGVRIAGCRSRRFRRATVSGLGFRIPSFLQLADVVRLEHASAGSCARLIGVGIRNESRSCWGSSI